MSVHAILQAATTATATNTVVAPVTPILTPSALLGSPTLTTWVATTDLPNAKVKYGYLIYQTYSVSGDGQGLASATGTTDWVSIPHVSVDFPNISVSASSSSTLMGGVITFTISGTVSYTQTTPGLYDVTATPL